jgi:hypothetical protein
MIGQTLSHYRILENERRAHSAGHHRPTDRASSITELPIQ